MLEEPIELIEIKSILDVSLAPNREMKLDISGIFLIGIISGSGKLKDLQTQKEYPINKRNKFRFDRLGGHSFLIRASRKKALVFSIMNYDLRL